MAEDVLDLYGDLTLNADGQLEPSASEVRVSSTSFIVKKIAFIEQILTV